MSFKFQMSYLLNTYWGTIFRHSGNPWMNHLVLLQWRHNEHDVVSNHQRHDCLLNHLFRRRSKKTSKLRVTGLCDGNSPVTGEFPAQRASNAENVSIWWRHHVGVMSYFEDYNFMNLIYIWLVNSLTPERYGSYFTSRYIFKTHFTN